jgi:DNA polymerase-4
LTVSVGAGPSKLIAKLACTLSKPDGLMMIAPDDVRSFLDPLPVRRLWSVGPVLGQTLEKLGIRSIGELAEFDPTELHAALGERASFLQALARGDDSRAVESDRAAKSYGEENTFEHDVLGRDIVTATLTAHAEAVARRLRHDGSRGRTITLKIKLARSRQRAADAPQQGPDYPIRTRSKTLKVATDDGRLIRKVACELWDAADVREAVRLLGVSVSNLQPAFPRQLPLFADSSDEDRLGPTVDAIEERFGRGAIRRAVEDPVKITPTLRRKRGE